MFVKIKKSCRYADPGGPHLPQIDFVEGSTVEICESLGRSVIANGDGEESVDNSHQRAVVEPESKDEGLTVESKDEAVVEPEVEPEPEVEVTSDALSKLSPKKRKFVEEYFVDSNETEAAIRAGYSESGSMKQGAKLLEDDDVKAAIAESRQ